MSLSLVVVRHAAMRHPVVHHVVRVPPHLTKLVHANAHAILELIIAKHGLELASNILTFQGLIHGLAPIVRTFATVILSVLLVLL